MIIVNCAQGEQAWYGARLGAVTASRVSDAISVLTRKSGNKGPGDPTDAADKYAYEIAFERISGVPYGAPIKAWTLVRGQELEPVARSLYEEQTGNIAMESGVILSDDRKFGYSSDGVLSDGKGLIEIKCPIDTIKIMDMLTTHDTSEYNHQMQFGMFLSGREYCDFIQYVPALEKVDKHFFCKRIHRDDDFIDDMVKKLIAFEARVCGFEKTLRQRAA